MSVQLSHCELRADDAGWVPGIAALQGIAFLLSLGLIFSIPMEGAVVVESVGRLSRLAGVAAAGAWLVAVAATGSLRRPVLFHGCVGLFVLWNVASLAWTIDVPRSLERAKTYIQLAVMTLLIWDLYSTRARIQYGLQAFVCGACVAAMGTVRNYLEEQSVFAARFTATGLHVDDLGVILALGLPIAWHLAWQDSNRGLLGWGWRGFNLCYLPLAIFAIGLSGTRGAAVAATPAAVYAFGGLFRLPSRLRLAAALVLIVGLGAVIPLVPASSLERLSTIGTEIADGDLNGRVELWRKGLLAFAERPWVGVGSYGFPAIPSNHAQHVAHSTFVSVLVELGLVGAVLVTFVGASVFRGVVRLPRRQRYFWGTVLCILALGISTLTWEHRKPTWLLLSLAVCASAVGDRDEETTKPSKGASRSLDAIKG